MSESELHIKKRIRNQKANPCPNRESDLHTKKRFHVRIGISSTEGDLHTKKRISCQKANYISKSDFHVRKRITYQKANFMSEKSEFVTRKRFFHQNTCQKAIFIPDAIHKRVCLCCRKEISMNVSNRPFYIVLRQLLFLSQINYGTNKIFQL